MLVVQQKTLSLPVQLASEGVQAIVGLLTEHDTCKMEGYIHAYLGQVCNSVKSVVFALL